MAEGGGEWLPGLPPGEYYPGMEDDFEVKYAPLAIWYRRKARDKDDVRRSMVG